MSVDVFRYLVLTCLPVWILVLNGIVLQKTCQAQKLKPNLTSDDYVVMLEEHQATPMTLTELQCADPDGGNGIVSADNVSPGKPCGTCFSIYPCGNDWCLVFTPMEEFDMLKVKSYSITIKCVAQNRQSAKTVVQVRLFKTTKPPTFQSHPRVVTLDETEKQELILQKVKCIDPDNSTVKVDLSIDPKLSKTGCLKCFSLEPCGKDWCLKFTPKVGSLSYTALPNYPMTLTCTDQEGEAVTSDIEVRVTKNSPPHFQTMFASTTVSSTSQVKAGTKVFHVNATDDEGDTLYYTMKTTPDVPHLVIGYKPIPSPADGAIVANGDLSQVCTPVVSCQITVSDGINQKVGPMVLDLTLKGANSAPSITNMDETIHVPEDTTVGSPVYKINILDEDKLNDMTLTLKANPPDAQGHFRLVGDQIILKSALNFESVTLRTAQLSLVVTDSGGCVSTTKTLTLSVTDINEPPEMANEKTTVSVYEGFISFTPEWSVQDEDFVDTKKYRITAGNADGRFAIDSTTGVITSLVEYDTDSGSMPKTRTFTVEVEDKGGLTTEGEVTVEIKDANDNAPFIVGGSRHYVVSDCTSPGTSLATLETDDLDTHFQFNSRVHLQSARSGAISLLSSGEVVLTSRMRAGDTATIEAWAVDSGKHPGPLRSLAPTYLTVRCVPCPPPTTPIRPQTWPTPPRQTNVRVIATTVGPPIKTQNTSNIAENLWWIILSSLLGLALLALLTWLLWRSGCCYYCGACGRRTTSHNNKVTKVRPQTPLERQSKIDFDPRRPTPTARPPPMPPTLAPVLDAAPPETPEPATVGDKNGHIYDFWKEKYNEDDYTSQPNRNSKPEPTKDAVNPLDHLTSNGEKNMEAQFTPPPNKNKCAIS